MTNEEALKIAKSSNPLLRGKIPLDKLNYVGCIIEAIEKQIPKKIAMHTASDGEQYFACPMCDTYLASYFTDDREKYCYSCGQRLEIE